MSLRFFRKKKTFRIIMVVTAAVVIPGFIIWGVSISGQDTRALAARVNRQPVTIQEYNTALGDVQTQYRKILGDNYQKAMQNINMEKLVLNSLIDEKLLEQQYGKRHIRTSDDEILEVIKSDSSFKDEKGTYSEERFRSVFSSMPPEDIKKVEDQVRKKLLYQKLRQEIVGETSIVIDNADLKPLVTDKTKPEDMEKIRKYVQMQKEEKYFQDWLAKIRAKSKIEIFLTPSKNG